MKAFSSVMTQENLPAQRPESETIIENYLNAAQTLIELGDYTQAELRLRDALKQADTSYIGNSRIVRLCLTRIAEFYRSQDRSDALSPIEKRLELMDMEGEVPDELAEVDVQTSQGRLPAIGRRAPRPPVETGINLSRVPPEVRKACQILGLPVEQITVEAIRAAWKSAVSDPTVHPDLGGEQEVAILLNNSRDTVLRWLDEQQPKLLKKFERIVRHNS